MKRARTLVAVGCVALAVGGAVWLLPLRRMSMSLERVVLAAEPTGKIRLEPVARGLPQITDIQFVPGAGTTAVVLQKNGEARLVKLPAYRERAEVDAEKAPLFLQVKVKEVSELGLLGLAFSPKFSQNGRFYLNYNPADGKTRTRVAEWRVDPARLGSDPAREERVVLEIEQPYPNHDGGGLAFGPDGFLYVGMGDGGYRGDPHGHSQNLGTLLGDMLRIDVEGRDPGKAYAVPKDNPFVGRPGAAPEIWAYGLRNPWRFSFDPKGRLIAGDVGQDLYEEVTLVPRGANLGWNVREAAHCYAPPEGCSTKDLVDPLFEYEHSLGVSVTGGLVYTGKAIPQLAGRYVFGDFGSGRIWSLVVPDTPRKVPAELVGRFPHAISTFARDPAGELYLGDFSGGKILRFVTGG
ncbi:MAG TPA: PQQ-dependent sugar dehydrogenase [Polyangiaceae bacterium]